MSPNNFHETKDCNQGTTLFWKNVTGEKVGNKKRKIKKVHVCEYVPYSWQTVTFH